MNLLCPELDASAARNVLRLRLFRLRRAAGVDLVTSGELLAPSDGISPTTSAIPIFILGLWLRGHCKKNIALVKAVFARFTSSAPAQPAAAGIAMPQTSM